MQSNIRPCAVITALRIFCAVALAGGFLPSSVYAAPGDDARVAAVKAAFVFNFAKFVNWPDARLRTSDNQMVFCVQRDDLDYRVVKDLEHKSINDRNVTVRILEPRTGIPDCHLLFLSGGVSDSEFDQLVKYATGLNVLLVSDMPDFAERGGHIALITDQNRLRFKINLGATTGAGLKVSSKLLQLAEIVATASE